MVTTSHGGYDARVGIAKILELMDDLGLKATFFIPGWTAEAHTAACEPIVTVRFDDGTQETAMVPRATGSSERPMSDAAIRAKFDMLAGMALPAATAARLADFILGLEAQGDCRDLPALLVSPEPEAAIFS